MESLQSSKLYTSCIHVQTTDTGSNHATVTVGNHKVWGGGGGERVGGGQNLVKRTSF